MAALGRLTRSSALRSFRTIISHTTRTQRSLHHNRCFEKHCFCSGSQVLWQRVTSKESNSESNSYSIYPALLAGLFGLRTIETAHADANEANGKPDVLSDSPSSYANLEEIARKEKKRIDEMLWNKGIRSYPRYTVGVKGQKVSIKFQVSPTCEVSQLIAKLVSKLGFKSEDGGGSYMVLRAWDSSVAWQLTLNNQETEKKKGKDKDTNIDEGDLCILLFRSLITSDKAEVEFMKQGSLSVKELDALVSVLQLAGGKLPQSRSFEAKPRQGTAQIPSAEKLIANLEAMGVRIYGVDELNDKSSNAEISWKNIAGYDKQKREIEDTILLALQSPDIYDDIARGTRCKFESNRPRAVLFEGPPGTGKTSCARVIATQAGVPLLYVPLEVVMSKYYGESERLMGKVFSLANELQDGALIFLDEVDAFAVARDSEMHEATRRMLSVLLRQIDGFEQDKRVIVIAATNRKQDLDPALISRFDSIITFDLPDQENRQEIAAQYAKHLTKAELDEFAKITEAMSGRDIRDVCQQAERQWASKIIRGQVTIDRHLPPLEEYIESAESRKKALRSIEEQRDRNPMLSTKKHQLDFCSAN